MLGNAQEAGQFSPLSCVPGTQGERHGPGEANGHSPGNQPRSSDPRNQRPGQRSVLPAPGVTGTGRAQFLHVAKGMVTPTKKSNREVGGRVSAPHPSQSSANDPCQTRPGSESTERLALGVTVAGTKSLCWTGLATLLGRHRAALRHLPGTLASWLTGGFQSLSSTPSFILGERKLRPRQGKSLSKLHVAEEGRRLEKLELPVVTLGCCFSSPRSEALLSGRRRNRGCR